MKAFSSTKENHTIFLPSREGLRAYAINKIVKIQSISNYSKLSFADGTTLIVAKVLQHFDSLLNPHQFIRIHRTHLINIRYIANVNLQAGAKVHLQNGEVIDISKRERPQVLKVSSGQII